MNKSVTIDIDEKLNIDLEELARQTGISPKEIIQEALKRRLWVLKFNRLREECVPFGQAAGYLTDEDVFRDIS